MARKRMISPEFWSDQKIGNLSLTARLLYIGIWNFADDCGRFPADSLLLKAQIFPYDPKIKVRPAMVELAEQKLIIFYQSAHCDFAFVRQWSKWQKIDKPQPSQLPTPPNILNGDVFDDCSTNGRRLVEPNIKEENRIEKNEARIKSHSFKLKSIIKETFQIRGWDANQQNVDEVFNQVYETLKDSNPRELFPYFKKSLQNFINQNADYLNSRLKLPETVNPDILSFD